MATVINSELVGVVTRIAVASGDGVAAGDALLFVESMKMEIPVESPAAGEVTKLHVAVGDNVKVGAPLVEVG